MKIIKPLKLGLLYKTYGFKQKHMFVVSGLVFFKLGADRLLLSEQSQWPRIMQQLGDQILDMAMPKNTGEFLAAGNAYAPAGRTVRSMETEIRIGRLAKALKVFGDRQWTLRGFLPAGRSEPEPFKAMPLTYGRAFGGPGYAANPQGKGYAPCEILLTLDTRAIPMPNIEDPRRPVTKPGKHYEPAGFGPLALDTPMRRKKAGTYNQDWLTRDYPGYAQDIDWSIFQAAPEDQWNKGFFEGDEEYQIRGMHPEKLILSGRLPNLRIRALIRKQDPGGEEFMDIPTRPDTVWFMPEQELGILIHRGQTEVADSDGLDVDCLLLAYENRADAPRPQEYYQEVLKSRLDPRSALAHVFNESQLSPEKSREQKAREQKEQTEAEAAALARKQKSMDEAMDRFWATSGVKKPEDWQRPMAEQDPLGVIPETAIKRGDFDLSPLLQKAEQLSTDLKKQADEKLKKMEQMLKEKNLRSCPSSDSPTPSQARADLKKEKRNLTRKVLTFGGQGDAGQTPRRPEFKAILENLEQVRQQSQELDEKKIAEIKQGLALVESQTCKGRQYAIEPTEPAKPLSASGRAHLRRLAQRLQRQGGALAGCDLAGADLSNLDFSGMNLKGIMLEQADLSGCCFKNADLEGAVLTAACLDRADFSGACLKEANLNKARGSGACFRKARLTLALLMEAVLEQGDFSEADFGQTKLYKTVLNESHFSKSRFRETVFLETRMPHTHWTGAQFEKCIFLDADLTTADFGATNLFRCFMVNLKATGLKLSQAVWRKVQIAGNSDLSGAEGNGFRATESGFRKTVFKAGRFEEALFSGCDLGEGDFEKGFFRKAGFHRSVLMSSRLKEADLQEADLFQALLRKADFTGANLMGANLWQADLNEIVLKDCRMKGARLMPAQKELINFRQSIADLLEKEA